MSTPVDRAELEKALEEVGRYGVGHNWETIVAAARVHLDTLPRTKMVEVWRVEWAYQGRNGDWDACCETQFTKAQADEFAASLKHHCACIKVTGPHQQCVPA